MAEILSSRPLKVLFDYFLYQAFMAHLSPVQTDLQSFSGEEAIDAPVAPILATGSSADFVGVGGTSDSIFVHDLSKLGDGPLLLEACPTVKTAGVRRAMESCFVQVAQLRDDTDDLII